MTDEQTIPLPTHSSFRDLTGHPPFERLTVLGFAGMKQLPSKVVAMWKCRCSCGNITAVASRALLGGHTRSCGCLSREMSSVNGSANSTHKKTGTPEHYTWMTMKARCSNPNAESYPNYGGRGITVCQRWMAFEPFLEDMGLRPSSRHSIDRIDNNGGYHCGNCTDCHGRGVLKSNCRWATIEEQNKNRRNVIYITHDGKTHSLKEWETITGIKSTALDRRKRFGWSDEETITTPAGYRRGSSLPHS